MKQEQNKYLLFYLWSRSTGPFSVFWFNSGYHYDGTVFLILSFTGGLLGTTTSPQQQNTANSKDLCEVWKNNTVFLIFLGDFSGSGWKKKLHKRRLLWSIYSRLPVTRSNFHIPSNRFLYDFTLDNSNSRQLELCSVSLEGSNYR